MSTIVAISTSTTQGGIGIIRMSGNECFKILNKIFVPKSKSKPKGYNIKYGHIIKSNNKEIIDEVLVSYFMKPKSYTTENMCEINSHGGYIVEKEILEECLKNGAVLAEPGEFTKRAFLNGRIDLIQAEAVADIINAKTEEESKASMEQLEGMLSKRIKNIQNKLLDVMSDIEASIDYPEYDIEETTNEKLIGVVSDIENDLKELNDSYKMGKILKEGIRTSIIGKPNVGKSSLLNLMLNEDRAIVSNIEGTTRDSIEEYINIDGIPLKIIDTAGIRNTNDEIEKIGVKRAINIINSSDLIIAVFDNSRELEKEDYDIIKLINKKNTIVLLNKSDKDKKIDKKNIANKSIIEFSTKTGEGLRELNKEIIRKVKGKQIKNKDDIIITNIRQKKHIEKAIKIAEETTKKIKDNITIDISAIYIKNIVEEIGYITGQNVSEDIINEIFAKFCLGK